MVLLPTTCEVKSVLHLHVNFYTRSSELLLFLTPKYLCFNGCQTILDYNKIVAIQNKITKHQTK